MRWIFFCLVAGNLLALIVYWQQQSPTPVNTSADLEIASGQRLTLVSEAAVTLPKAKDSQSRMSKGNKRCFVLGPYQDELDARHARARAEALGMAGRTTKTELPGGEPREFWVHVPPRASRDAAIRVLKELQRRGIDSYIITKGELSEGVSLGLFRQRESAEQLVERVKKYAIPVAVREVRDIAEEFWFEVPVTDEFGERLRQRVMADDRGVSWQMSQCE
ncbi:hypothetical protein [Candidatus Thalassolituus haligoni]|jgi:hypothetical protein|uniref:hypothetical protein n=1 Tax=Candidatus Thalassolituus haligoni TaxID=3100113 RepID=UPI0035119B1E|tara:strand:- start:117 stop:776 length:660 start_codon:yes stop_codon:yes gene_type:complete